MSRESWHVPTEREPGVLYMHGQPGTDYAAVRAIEVDGQRFERERTCHVVSEHVETNEEWLLEYSCGCSVSGWGFRFCPLCGAKVVITDE